MLSFGNLILAFGQENSHTMRNRPHNSRLIASSNQDSLTSQQKLANALSHRNETSSSSKVAVKKSDDLTRIFNTALVCAQTGIERDFSSDLREVTESTPFKVILNAVRQLAAVQQISERQAAEEVIQTFRKLDEVWNDYIFREGLDRVRNPRN